jgi:hypothetical protein
LLLAAANSKLQNEKMENGKLRSQKVLGQPEIRNSNSLQAANSKRLLQRKIENT